MAAEHDSDHSHPGVGEYVEIGIFLAVITAVEVALYYVGRADLLSSQVIIPSLLVLTAMKFVLVVAWFMHLRFDHRLFRRLFYTGLALAGSVFAVVLALFYLGTAGNV